tara:strand:+ start:195 stop:497 length:303 start_codon:yes stop_codon:yes gene_type:complete
MSSISYNSVPQNVGRKLPQTTTILHNKNEALKNKVKCLEETLRMARLDIQKLILDKELLEKENTNMILKHKKEISKLTLLLEESNEIIQLREEFIKDHCM